MKLFGLFGKKKQPISTPAPKSMTPFEQYRGTTNLEDLPDDRETLEAIIEEAEARNIVGDDYRVANLAFIKLGAVLHVPEYYSEAAIKMLHHPEQYSPQVAEELLRKGVQLDQYWGYFRLIELLVQRIPEVHFDPFEAYQLFLQGVDKGIINKPRDLQRLPETIIEGCHTYVQYHQDFKLRLTAAIFLRSYYEIKFQEDSSDDHFLHLLFWQMICGGLGVPDSIEMLSQWASNYSPEAVDDLLRHAIADLFANQSQTGIRDLIIAASLRHPDALMLLSLYLAYRYDTDYEGLQWLLCKMAAELGNKDAMHKLHTAPNNHRTPMRDCRFDYWAEQEKSAAENNSLPYMLCKILFQPDPAPYSWRREYPHDIAHLKQYSAYEELPDDRESLLNMTEQLTRFHNQNTPWLLRQCYKRLALCCNEMIYLIPYGLELLKHGFPEDGLRVLYWVADAKFPKDLLITSHSLTQLNYFLSAAYVILQQNLAPAALAEMLLLKSSSLGSGEAFEELVDLYTDFDRTLFSPINAYHTIQQGANIPGFNIKNAYDTLNRRCRLAIEYGKPVVIRQKAAAFLWKWAGLCAKNKPKGERKELMQTREMFWRMIAAVLGDEDAKNSQHRFLSHWQPGDVIGTLHSAVNYFLEGDRLSGGIMLCASASMGSADAQLLLGQLIKQNEDDPDYALQYLLYSAAAKQGHPDACNMTIDYYDIAEDDEGISQELYHWPFPAERTDHVPSLIYILGKLAIVPIPVPHEFWYPPALASYYKYRLYENLPDSRDALLGLCGTLEKYPPNEVHWMLCQCRKKLLLDFHDLSQLILLARKLPSHFSGFDGIQILHEAAVNGDEKAAFCLAEYYKDRDFVKAVDYYRIAQELDYPHINDIFSNYLQRLQDEYETVLNPAAAALMWTISRAMHFDYIEQAGEANEKLYARYIYHLLAAAGAGVEEANAEYQKLLETEEIQKGQRTVLIRQSIYADGKHDRELFICQVMDALLGNTEALYALAVELMEKSPAPAHYLLTYAANTGLVPAMLKLGWRYRDPSYPFHSLEAAEHWFLAAFDQGSATAATQLGILKHNAAIQAGKHNRDTFSALQKEARLWFEKGADMGNGLSMYFLGVYYRNGVGGLYPNDHYGKSLIRQAAEMDVKEAIDYIDKHF